MSTNRKNVVVIGAGVSGLTTALLLLETYNLNSLTIVSSELPGDMHSHDYASPWAGANWMSFVTDPVKEARIVKWDAITYNTFKILSQTEKHCGIRRIKAKIFKNATKLEPWYIHQNFVDDIKKIPEKEIMERNLDPSTTKGFEFDTFTITPVVYCHYLRQKIERLGGKIKRIPKITNIQQFIEESSNILFNNPDLIINCTGLGSSKFLSQLPGEADEISKVYPVKGQIVVIQNDLPYQIIIDNLPESSISLEAGQGKQFFHIFPRGDGYSIVGGVMIPNDWSKSVSSKLTESILENIARHIPELGKKDDIIKIYDYSALRPSRKGGVRVEYKEYFDGKLKIIHNYGIGGSGYQSSFGISMEVLNLAENVLGKPVKCPFKL